MIFEILYKFYGDVNEIKLWKKCERSFRFLDKVVSDSSKKTH